MKWIFSYLSIRVMLEGNLYADDAVFRSELTKRLARDMRHSHPRSTNAERSAPGGAYHPPER
jgi:hypothetical protein